MTDHKFTDAETVKALECCNTPGSCCECPYYGINEVEYDDLCVQTLINDILPLINRQKAEIERLNKEVDRLSQCVLYHDGIVSDLKKDVFNAKAEAIKEFVERAIDLAVCKDNGDGTERMFVSIANLRKIAKEMTEELK